MCELNVNMVEGTNTITLMEDVVRLVVNNNEITITGMLGETLTVQGKIMHVDLTKQEALIRKID
ncbi:MAG TPA: CooT family nickel-binding protein [archaeon]|nr:CooT family nickel-binding protein [archaeon]